MVSAMHGGCGLLVLAAGRGAVRRREVFKFVISLVWGVNTLSSWRKFDLCQVLL